MPTPNMTPEPDDPPRDELAAATSLLDGMPGGVLLLGPEGEVRYLNGAAAEALGVAREDVLGRDFFRDLFPELEEEGLGARCRSGVRAGEMALRWETSLRPATAPLRMCLAIRAHRVGEGWCALVLLEDRAGVVAEEARRRVAERMAAVGELATGVAHEVNNPLASIKSFAQLLSYDATDPEQVQALEIISQECSRVARTVDRLLAFAGQQRVRGREAVNLTTLAETVIALKRYVLETSGVEIVADLDPSVPLVQGERGALQRAVLILLHRAEGALVELATNRRLAIRTGESREGVVLEVTDNGRGIDPEELPKMLDPYAAPAEEGPMGLSTASAVVRDHGGRIWVESAADGGTSVRFSLPRLEAAAPAVAGAEPAVRPTSRAASPLRILIADDEASLRLALAMYLERHGHEVTEAADAHEALRAATQESFDVALIDVRMPGNGIDLATRLETLPEWRGRTILMTGDHVQARVREEIGTGRRYLAKPFDMQEVVKMVEEVGTTPRPGRA